MPNTLPLFVLRIKQTRHIADALEAPVLLVRWWPSSSVVYRCPVANMRSLSKPSSLHIKVSRPIQCQPGARNSQQLDVCVKQPVRQASSDIPHIRNKRVHFLDINILHVNQEQERRCQVSNCAELCVSLTSRIDNFCSLTPVLKSRIALQLLMLILFFMLLWHTSLLRLLALQFSE